MLKKHLYFFLAAVLLCVAGCRTSSHLPDKKMPDDFMVRIETSGGMVPNYKMIYISMDSCSYEERKSGTVRKEKFLCSKEELGKLYQSGLDQHFYEMTSENHGQVYDRGGTVLEMGPKKKPYRVSDSGSDFLVEKYKTGFNALLKEINTLVTEKLGQN